MNLVPAVIGPGAKTAPGYAVDLDTGDMYYEKLMRKLKPSGKASSHGKKHPYHRINLGSENGKTRIAKPWHRVVLASKDGFMPESNIQTRHLDGNPLNNHPDNLAWGTAKENAEDKKLHRARRKAVNDKKTVYAGS